MKNCLILLEYNPQLGEVTRATRVAYVKFMKKKMVADEGKPEDDNTSIAEGTNTTTATITNEKPKTTFKKAEV